MKNKHSMEILVSNDWKLLVKTRRILQKIALVLVSDVIFILLPEILDTPTLPDLVLMNKIS